uniref:Uncharacterized protein n=1 Tax=Megaselia scalaris TaxID=36166 RepID=T1GMQ5_MEGSC
MSGSSILSSLVNQRETLKGARTKLRTIGNTLGLSNHTMKLIERRFAEDKYILFGGMFLTLVVISIVVYFIVLPDYIRFSFEIKINNNKYEA